jgi:hypothetical protein
VHIFPASPVAADNVHRLHPLAPVVGLDIDGTLGEYYEHFSWFASLYLQRVIRPSWNSHEQMEFSDALDLPKDVYRQIKLAYRQGGMKRCLPMVPGADELVRWLRRDCGVQVWICTTRPWNRLDNIDPDTQFWIDRNLGRVDGVIYGEEKYHDLIDCVGMERVIGVIDDLPENFLLAEDIGLPVLLRRDYHNMWWRNPNATGTTYGMRTWLRAQMMARGIEIRGEEDG